MAPLKKEILVRSAEDEDGETEIQKCLDFILCTVGELVTGMWYQVF